MKKIVVDKLMNLIKENGQYDDIKLAEIRYGLEGLYLTFSKLIVIFLLAYLLGIIKEVIIFLIIYNIIRATSFGLHATKSCSKPSDTFFQKKRKPLRKSTPTPIRIALH